MFNKYFVELEKSILKSAVPAPKKTGKGRAAAGRKTAGKTDNSRLMEAIGMMVPSHLRVGEYRLVDSSGYTPEGVDFIAYREMFHNTGEIMGGCIPSELAYGTFHVAPRLSGESVVDVLGRVVQAKKLNRFSGESEEAAVIPAFVISYSLDLPLPHLKNAIYDYYVSRSINDILEFDIIMVMNKGLVVKNWREKRSYIALETGKDTLMWFFILMNEYLDIDKGKGLDLRDYVRNADKYKEY